MEDEDDEEQRVRAQIDGEGRRRKKEIPTDCRKRIDVLAIPNKRHVLCLYKSYANVLPQDKVEKIKELLQELYAMTPEETEKYFMELKHVALLKRRRKGLKEVLKRQYKRMKRKEAIARAYRLVESILTQGMLYAFNNKVPPLVSVRLRNLADIILEQICDLLDIDIPSRVKAETKQELFLIDLADWAAIAVEQIYYDVQLKKNEELEKLEKEREELEKSKKESPQETATTGDKDYDLLGAEDEELLDVKPLEEG